MNPAPSSVIPRFISINPFHYHLNNDFNEPVAQQSRILKCTVHVGPTYGMLPKLMDLRDFWKVYSHLILVKNENS